MVSSKVAAMSTEVSSFVRIRLCIRYALRESDGDLISAWKLLYGFNVSELPTVKDVLLHLSERLDLASVRLSIFNKDYEIPVWCSSRVFSWDDELDIWILPPRFSKQQRSTDLPCANLDPAYSSAQNVEDQKGSTKSSCQLTKKHKSSRKSIDNDKERLRSKQNSANALAEVASESFESVEKIETSKEKRHFTRVSENVEQVAKRADPQNPHHIYFLSNSDTSETEGDRSEICCRSFARDGGVKDFELTGAERVKDLSCFALPYEVPRKKKKKMLKRRTAIQQDNVSFVMKKIGNGHAIRETDGPSEGEQARSSYALEEMEAIEQQIAPYQNNVTEEDSEEIDDQRPLTDSAQLAPLNPLELKTATKIKFKIMELNDQLESYLSDWKEAVVVFYNPLSNEVTLKGFNQRTPAMFAIEDNSAPSEALMQVPWDLLYDPHIARND